MCPFNVKDTFQVVLYFPTWQLEREISKRENAVPFLLFREMENFFTFQGKDTFYLE